MSNLRQANEARIELWRDYLDLNVALSFELGTTAVSVRELLELDKDQILKLPRSTGEGLDVFADNQPLVRGEIVVIEDRAAVRVSAVIMPEDY